MKPTRAAIAALAWPVRLEAEADGSAFIVSFPDFFFTAAGQQISGGYSFGETRGAALTRAADLLATILANLLADGLPIPEPSPANGSDTVGVDPLTAAKLELYRALHRAGITQAELARRLGTAPQQVTRLFDLDHASRLDHIESALRALGRRLVVTTKAA